MAELSIPSTPVDYLSNILPQTPQTPKEELQKTLKDAGVTELTKLSYIPAVRNLNLAPDSTAQEVLNQLKTIFAGLKGSEGFSQSLSVKHAIEKFTTIARYEGMIATYQNITQQEINFLHKELAITSPDVVLKKATINTNKNKIRPVKAPAASPAHQAPATHQAPAEVKPTINYGAEYSKVLKNLQNDMSMLQKGYNESGLGERAMDNVVGLFTDDTAEATYRRSLENTQKTALATLATLNNKTKNLSFPSAEGAVIESVRQEISKITGASLQSVGFGTMAMNSLKAAPETVNLAIAGTAGMIEGSWEAIKSVPEMVVALAKGAYNLMAYISKLVIQDSATQQDLYTKSEALYGFLTNNPTGQSLDAMKKVGKLLSEKMGEIQNGNLSSEEKAKAIGRIFGQIEGLLATGPLLGKAGSIAKAAGLERTGKVLGTAGELLGAGKAKPSFGPEFVNSLKAGDKIYYTTVNGERLAGTVDRIIDGLIQVRIPKANHGGDWVHLLKPKEAITNLFSGKLEQVAANLGKISAKNLEKALATATEIADTQIPTLMKAGRISAEFAAEIGATLKNAIGVLKNAATMPIGLGAVTNAIAKIEGVIVALGAKIAAATGPARASLTALQESLRAQLTSIVESLSEKYTSLKTSISDGIDRATTAVKKSATDKKAEAIGTASSLRAQAEKVYNATGEFLAKSGAQIESVYKGGTKLLTDSMNTLKTAALDAGKVTVEAVKAAIATIHTVLKAIGESISKASGAAKDKLVELYTGLEKSLGDMSKTLGSKFDEAKAAVSARVDRATEAVKKSASDTRAEVYGATQGLRETAQKAFDAAGEMISKSGAKIDKIYTGGTQVLRSSMNTIRDAAIGVAGITVEAVKSAIEAIQKVLARIGEEISKVTGPARDKLVELKVGLEMSIQDMTNSLSEKFASIKSKIGGFEKITVPGQSQLRNFMKGMGVNETRSLDITGLTGWSIKRVPAGAGESGRVFELTIPGREPVRVVGSGQVEKMIQQEARVVSESLTASIRARAEKIYNATGEILAKSGAQIDKIYTGGTQILKNSMNTLRDAAAGVAGITVEAVKAAVAKIQEVLKAIGESISKASGAAKNQLTELKVGLEMGLKDMVNGLGNTYKEAKVFASAKVEQGTVAVKGAIEAERALSLKNRIVGYRELVSKAKGNPSSIDDIKNLITSLTEARNTPKVLEALKITRAEATSEINKFSDQLNRIEKSLPAKTQSVPVRVPKLATA